MKKEEESLESSEGKLVESKGSKNILHSSLDNFMNSRSMYDFEYDKDLNFMYTNKYNFCSGYFPEFITLNDNLSYNLSENNSDFNYYYLYTKNGKYLKQLSNCNSRYDGKYFKEMYMAYKISKKLKWGYGVGNNVNSFNNLYLYRPGGTQSLGETGISIPKDLGMEKGSGVLGGTGISIPRNQDRVELYCGSKKRAKRTNGGEGGYNVTFLI